MSYVDVSNLQSTLTVQDCLALLGERLAALVIIRRADECWVWVGARTQAGYAVARLGGRLVYVHRFVYERALGHPIPAGLQIDHLCRVRHCINLSHLEAVTQRENILRGVAPSAFAARATHCIHGHKFDEANTRMTKQGARRCRACHRQEMRKARL